MARRLIFTALFVVTLCAGSITPGVAHAAPSPRLAAAATGLPFVFVQSGIRPRALPIQSWPYNSTKAISLVDTRPRDRYGVRVALIGGKLYNHPFGQAAYGMQLLNGYRVTRDPRYLARARAQARRLYDTRVASRGGWFLPHRYPFSRHSVAADPMPSPFYSAMAQGAALGLFTRMYRTTREPGFKATADALFKSFLLPPAKGLPWVVEVDTAHRLWLEEWPKDGSPDFTYNGHTFASYGLYDYAMLTSDPRALALFDGAATTTLKVAGSIRLPGWISRYCLTHSVRSAGYHGAHVGQLLKLHALTGQVAFAQLSDVFRLDYESPMFNATVQLAAGSHTGYVFSSTGHPVASRTATLARTARVTIDQRTRVYGNGGYWFRVTNGRWRGYLVREAYPRAFALNAHQAVIYDPARGVAIAAGARVKAVKVSRTGVVTARKTFVLAAAVSTQTTARSLIDGRSTLRIESGSLAGWWVVASQVHLT